LTEIVSERVTLLNQSVLIDWHPKAAEKINNKNKKSLFYKNLEQRVFENTEKSSFQLVQNDDDLFVCKVSLRKKNIVSNIIIDLLDVSRSNGVGINTRTKNVYLYGASGTIFEPKINEFFGEFLIDGSDDSLC
tara:strand:+ start:756 stop:1154 length:399 start_codon:yes stop_codon:yes gene_type:complete